MRILLVEDEAEMATALSSALKRYDMVVDHAPTLAEAEEAISADVHAAVLLDRQLPDGDGLTLIPKLRARADGVPIIVLTARGELADRIAGLDSGADDYLAKPFAVEELLARCAPCCGGPRACRRTSSAPAASPSMSAIARPASTASRSSCHAASCWCSKP